MVNPRPNRAIQLGTYSGNAIKNEIEPDPDQQYITIAMFGLCNIPGLMSSVKQLTPPTGRYNCFGLVFASRRTCLLAHPEDFDSCDRVLKEDLYRLVDGDCQIGDLAAYRLKDSASIDHVGIVVRVDSLGSSRIPFVWSKWGRLGEYEHHFRLVPRAHEYSIEFWRLG